MLNDFNIKMENFRCKTRLVVRGNMTKMPATIMYDSVQSRETVRIAMIFATLNDLEVKLADYLNPCIQATLL